MIVLLENNWASWTVMMENEQKKRGGLPTNPIPKQLYTSGDKDKMGKSTGWSKLGTKRYNEIVKLVKVDRAANKVLEEDLLILLQGSTVGGSAEDDSDDEMPYVDMFEV